MLLIIQSTVFDKRATKKAQKAQKGKHAVKKFLINYIIMRVRKKLQVWRKHWVRLAVYQAPIAQRAVAQHTKQQKTRKIKQARSKKRENAKKKSPGKWLKGGES